MKRLRAAFEPRVFEHAEDAVVEGDLPLAPVARNSPTFCSKSALVFGPTSNCWSPGLSSSTTRAVRDHEVDRQDELDALLAAVADHSLGLLDAGGRDVVRLVFVGRIFGDAEATWFAVELGGRLAERHGERAGGEHLADLAAVDHRFQVVELVDLEAAEDDQLRVEAAHHRAGELAFDVLAEGDAIHRGGHDDAAGVEAAGRECFEDVDRG